MIVRRIRVRAFRKFGDQEIAFAPGLNVIRGRNDAGKSTLHLAFSAALFPIRPSEAKSYRPWDEAPRGVPHGGQASAAGEVVLEFEADGHRYELRKDFGSQKTALRSEAGAWETSKDAAERVGALLGLGSLALFRATAHIGQWQLAAVQDESREIGAHLSRIMTGTDGDAARVLKTVAEWIRRQEIGLRGRPATAPGPLKRDQDRLKALADERGRLDADVKDIESAAAERDRRAARTAALETAVAEDDALLAANRRLHELDRRWEELGRLAGELAARLERIDAAARDLAAADRDPALQFPPISDEALSALQQAEVRAQILRQQLAELERPRGADGPVRGAGPAHRFGLPSLSALAGAAGLAGIVLILTHRQPAGLAALAAAAGLAAAAALAGGRLNADAERAAVRDHEYAQQLASLQNQAADAAAEVRHSLERLGVTSAGNAVARRRALRAVEERRKSAAQILDGLLGGQTQEGLTESHRQAQTELGAVHAQRDDPDLVLRRLDAAGFQRFQIEAQRRRQAFEDEKAALQRLEGRLAGRSPQEALARVDEEIAETEARLAREQRQVAALRLTHDVLDQAHRATIVPGRARLEELASGYLRRLSDGAYERITVDEQTLAPRVWVGPPKEWADVSAREIGSGGVDQCYLALRLGLADLLAEGRRPPLFLDDPFLAYDEDRQASALAFVHALARDRQIFLFTCRTAYDRYADHVVVLSGDEPRPTHLADVADRLGRA